MQKRNELYIKKAAKNRHAHGHSWLQADDSGLQEMAFQAIR
jgi:hypothetical protein